MSELFPFISVILGNSYQILRFPIILPFRRDRNSLFGVGGVAGSSRVDGVGRHLPWKALGKNKHCVLWK